MICLYEREAIVDADVPTIQTQFRKYPQPDALCHNRRSDVFQNIIQYRTSHFGAHQMLLFLGQLCRCRLIQPHTFLVLVTVRSIIILTSFTLMVNGNNNQYFCAFIKPFPVLLARVKMSFYIQQKKYTKRLCSKFDYTDDILFNFCLLYRNPY